MTTTTRHDSGVRDEAAERLRQRINIGAEYPEGRRELHDLLDAALDAAYQRGFNECARRTLAAIRRDRGIPEGEPLLTILDPDAVTAAAGDDLDPTGEWESRIWTEHADAGLAATEGGEEQEDRT